MALNLPSKIGAVLNSIYLICVIVFAIAIAYNHVQLITHDYPLDYNEGGMLAFTATLVEGGNPHSLESQPSRISLYPVFYNMVVAPFSAIFGNTFQLHRAIAGLFILASCVLCFYFGRKESVAPAESFVAAAILYAGLLFYSTPIASPNSLGLFFFLAAIFVPWVYNFSTRSLCASIFLGMLAFYTKQYFVACLGYVALYVFLAVSKSRAIYFGVAALLVFIAVLTLIIYTFPYYLEDTFFSVRASTVLAASDDQVTKQLKKFGEIYLPLLLVLLAALMHPLYCMLRSGKQSVQGPRGQGLVDVVNFGQPLLLRKPNYIWVCCACSLIIFVFVLGKNRGNFLTYLFQLVSPFLLVGIFALSSKMPKWRWPFRVLIVLALYKNYAMLPSDFAVEEENWITIKEEISQAEDVYASTLFLREIIDKGGPIYLTGSTRYFMFAADLPDFFVKSKPEHRVAEVWERYVESIQAKIENQEFDLLLMDHWMSLPTAKPSLAFVAPSDYDTLALLKAHYTKTDVLMVPLADRLGGGKYRVDVWKPKTAASESNSE